MISTPLFPHHDPVHVFLGPCVYQHAFLPDVDVDLYYDPGTPLGRDVSFLVRYGPEPENFRARPAGNVVSARGEPFTVALARAVDRGLCSPAGEPLRRPDFRCGGSDGTRLFVRIVRQAPAHVEVPPEHCIEVRASDDKNPLPPGSAGYRHACATYLLALRDREARLVDLLTADAGPEDNRAAEALALLLAEPGVTRG